MREDCGGGKECALNQALRWDLGVLSRFVFPTALFRIPSECSPSFHSRENRGSKVKQLVMVIYRMRPMYRLTSLILTSTLGGTAIVLTEKTSDLPKIT